MIISKEFKEVRSESEFNRKRDWGCVVKGFGSELPKITNLDLRQNNLRELAEMWDQ